MPGGITSALFGRMVTSDPRANIEAAIHVAHVFTVHPQETETDYFTVAADLSNLGDANTPGADHIGESELTAGLFYGYVVDLPTLVSNIEGCAAENYLAPDLDRSIAAATVARLVNLIAYVSPGAKRGPTAPYTWAQAILVEVGDRQPRSLANAYRTAITPDRDAALEALRNELQNYDRVYSREEVRRYTAMQPDLNIAHATQVTQPELSAWVAEVVNKGLATDQPVPTARSKTRQWSKAKDD